MSPCRQLIETFYLQAKHQDKVLEVYTGAAIGADTGGKSKIMEALKEHARASLHWESSSAIRDLALLATLNLICHYDKTLFGTILSHAHLLQLEAEAEKIATIRLSVTTGKKTPLTLAKEIVEENKPDKRQLGQLLRAVLAAHHADREEVDKLALYLVAEARDAPLKEVLKTYHHEQQQHQACLEETLKQLSPCHSPKGWRVISHYKLYCQGLLDDIKDAHLKDIAIVFCTQRQQHYNMALFEYEALLADYLAIPGAAKLEAMYEQEKGNDVSFNALAEGSLLSAGLNAPFYEKNLVERSMCVVPAGWNSSIHYLAADDLFMSFFPSFYPAFKMIY